MSKTSPIGLSILLDSDSRARLGPVLLASDVYHSGAGLRSAKRPALQSSQGED